MVNTNKVLTVSYGTFSCTLEGFDDSFEMMKAVAEYFRDLASDDRYFGAEPPSLDAETLAQIASKRTTQKISARKDGDNVVLAPTTQEDSPQVTHPPHAAPVPIVPAASIAERLQRIRNVVDSDANDESEAYSENEHVQDPAADTSLAEAIMADPVDEIVDEMSEVSASVEDLQESDQVETENEPTLAEEPVVVAEVSETPEAEPAEVHSNEGQTPSEDAVADEAIETSSEPAVEDPPLEAEQAEEIAEAVEAPKEKITDAIKDVVAVEQTETEASDAEIEDTSFEDSLSAALEEEPIEEPEQSTADDVKEDIEADLEFEDSLAAALGDDSLDVQPVAEEQRKPRVHVIKVNAASDAEDAPEDGLEAELDKILNEGSEDTPNAKDTAQDGDDMTYVLGPDLAVTEDDTVTDPAPIAPRRVKAQSEDTVRSDSLLRHERQDVSRLMKETDEQLSNPSSNRRRSALAHLRAAVAATMADQSIETASRKEDNSDAYREDLKTVVKPKRPETRKLRSETTDPAKTPPLRLVAEQRIDPVEEETTSPVQEPAAASVQPKPEGYGTFEEYSNAVGASNLEDKLEAAASYLYFVKGMEGFTRPQLMGTVKNSAPEEFNREDGLRGFGELIRTGKIKRRERGVFEASADIGFHPDELKAG